MEAVEPCCTHHGVYERVLIFGVERIEAVAHGAARQNVSDFNPSEPRT